MYKNILITGANGYIGKHVVDFLFNNNKNILACDFQNTKIKKEIDFVNIDILNEATNPELFNLLNKPDNVIHLAWQDGFNHYAQSHINDVIKHFYFLKNMIDSGVKSITVIL